MADFEADLTRPFGVAMTGGAAVAVLIASTTAGSFTFTAPTTGVYLFGGTGAGGGSGAGGGVASAGSGAEGYVRKSLRQGQAVAIVVGAGGQSIDGGSGNPGGATTFTFPDGSTMTLGGGGGGTPSNPGNGGTISGADAGYAGTSFTGVGNAASPITLNLLLSTFPFVFSSIAYCGVGGISGNSVGNSGAAAVALGV